MSDSDSDSDCECNCFHNSNADQSVTSSQSTSRALKHFAHILTESPLLVTYTKYYCFNAFRLTPLMEQEIFECSLILNIADNSA